MAARQLRITPRQIAVLVAVVVVGLVVGFAVGVWWGIAAAAIVLAVNEVYERVARRRVT